MKTVRRLCLSLLLGAGLLTMRAEAQIPIVIDADTGNEMDDLYAIVSALLDEDLEVQAVISAHFNNEQLLTDSLWHIYPTKDINTVAISQEENLKLLGTMDRMEVPHPVGCDRIVGYAWGYYEGAPIPTSSGVEYIIAEARKASPAGKLNVVCLGAVTNVAAAILLAPEIASNIRLYALTMRYNEEKSAWNKNSFNARNDINALDLVLNNEELELIVIPGNVSRTLVFDRDQTANELQKINHPVVDILLRRWDEVSAGGSWIMWDLALVEAIADPSLAKIKELTTPPENTTRTISVYVEIDNEQMTKRFFEKMVTLDQ